MKILVLAGGGSAGSWEVGCIKKLAEAGKSWDLIAGVSVGALNGLYLAMHNKEDVKVAAKELEDIWLGIKGTEDVIKPWLPGWLNYLAAWVKGSLKTTTPLLALIESKFDQKKLTDSNVGFKVGTVGLGSGQFRTVLKSEPNFARWVLASAAMPVVMPPVELDGDKWVDGGVRNQTPIMSVMPDILAAISKKEDVEMDIILTGPTHDEVLSKDPSDITNIMQITMRCAQLAIDEIYISDLDKLGFLPKAVKYTIYEPNEPIKLDSMEFPPKDLKDLIQLGYDETAQALKSMGLLVKKTQ